jgi:hypothetical protein
MLLGRPITLEYLHGGPVVRSLSGDGETVGIGTGYPRDQLRRSVACVLCVLPLLVGDLVTLPLLHGSSVGGGPSGIQAHLAALIHIVSHVATDGDLNPVLSGVGGITGCQEDGGSLGVRSADRLQTLQGPGI